VPGRNPPLAFVELAPILNGVEDEHEERLRLAIELARDSVRLGGGPFGAVIAREGAVLATGMNQVTTANDPTAHAEIVALREACRALGTFALPGAIVYASCEPCPMCLAALYWARIERVYFASDRREAAAHGFDDERLYGELARPSAERSLPLVQLLREQGGAPFRDWQAKSDRTEY